MKFGYGPRFWLRKLVFWLRFGYGVSVLVTIWLRGRFWLRVGPKFGYGIMLFGYGIGQARIWFGLFTRNHGFWLRYLGFGYATTPFGYGIWVLVTFWLRNHAFWSLFGYGQFGYGPVPGKIWLRTIWLRFGYGII